MINQREAILFTGISRTGKSTLFREMISRAERLIIIDTLAEYGRLSPPFPALTINSIENLYDYLADARGKNYRIVFEPENLMDTVELKDGSESTIFNEVCRVVYEHLDNVVLGVEELADHTKPGYAPLFFQRIVRSGGHHGISVYATTQRPKEIWTGFRGQLTKFISFKLYDDSDLAWVASAIRDKKEALSLASLENLNGAPGRRIKGKHYKEYVL